MLEELALLVLHALLVKILNSPNARLFEAVQGVHERIAQNEIRKTSKGPIVFQPDVDHPGQIAHPLDIADIRPIHLE